MAAVKRALNVTVELSAAIANLRVQGGVLAQFAAGDRFEIEPEGESGPTVTLLINGRPFAIASVADRDGRLLATITDAPGNPAQERYDSWQMRKCETAKG